MEVKEALKRSRQLVEDMKANGARDVAYIVALEILNAHVEKADEQVEFLYSHADKLTKIIEQFCQQDRRLRNLLSRTNYELEMAGLKQVWKLKPDDIFNEESLQPGGKDGD